MEGGRAVGRHPALALAPLACNAVSLFVLLGLLAGSIYVTALNIRDSRVTGGDGDGAGVGGTGGQDGSSSSLLTGLGSPGTREAVRQAVIGLIASAMALASVLFEIHVPQWGLQVLGFQASYLGKGIYLIINGVLLLRPLTTAGTVTTLISALLFTFGTLFVMASLVRRNLLRCPPWRDIHTNLRVYRGTVQYDDDQTIWQIRTRAKFEMDPTLKLALPRQPAGQRGSPTSNRPRNVQTELTPGLAQWKDHVESAWEGRPEPRTLTDDRSLERWYHSASLARTVSERLRRAWGDSTGVSPHFAMTQQTRDHGHGSNGRPAPFRTMTPPRLDYESCDITESPTRSGFGADGSAMTYADSPTSHGRRGYVERPPQFVIQDLQGRDGRPDNDLYPAELAPDRQTHARSPAPPYWHIHEHSGASW